MSDDKNEQTRRPKECATPKEGSLLSRSPKPPGNFTKNHLEQAQPPRTTHRTKMIEPCMDN